MAASPSPEIASPAAAARQRVGAVATRLRVASGLVLFCFVAMHLLNHALGLVSLATMEAGRRWIMAPWHSAPGQGLLVLALLVHVAQAYWSIYRRRHLRMPPWQWLQLLLGLCIPLVLVHHVVGTAMAAQRFGYDPDYTVVVLVQWVLQPHLAVGQALLVVVAWAHGCMGLHFWLRNSGWYRRVNLLLYTVAILLPVLALLGFAQAGRYIGLLALDQRWVLDILDDARSPDPTELAALLQTRDAILLGLLVLLLATFAARIVRQLVEARRSVRITYPGQQVVTVPRGFSVLESSRQAGIAHTAICGGRGRCSTCRVRVLAGAQALPPPNATEARVLARVQAPSNVRLACQLRPHHDITVLPLIPSSQQNLPGATDPGFMAGREREICVLFADLRGFTRMSEQRLPYDVVFLLNRYFEAVGNAIEAAGGIANQFTGDGVMALFGVHSSAELGTRQAVRAALAMQEALARLSEDLREELPAPLALGIGIHCGPTVVGHMGRGVATYLTAVGDTVNTASRLQDQTKQFGCPLVISDQAARRAGLDTSGLRHAQIQVRNRDGSINVHAVDDLRALRWYDDAGHAIPVAPARVQMA